MIFSSLHGKKLSTTEIRIIETWKRERKMKENFEFERGKWKEKKRLFYSSEE